MEWASAHGRSHNGEAKIALVPMEGSKTMRVTSTVSRAAMAEPGAIRPKARFRPSISRFKKRTRTFAALYCLLVAFAVSAQELRPLPPLLRTLSDEVGVMSTDNGLQLSRALEEVLERTGVRVVMVIAETTRPETVEDYAQRLAGRWRRELQLDTDRSVFVVLALRDRELQVMPGKAVPHIERELERAGTLQKLAPLLRSGRYFEALMKLNSEIDRLIRTPEGRT